MLKPLDVIRFFDNHIDPPKQKMAACVEPTKLWFFYINSGPRFQPTILLTHADHSAFLTYDSHLSIQLLELTDGEVGEAPIGRIHESLIPEILHIAERSPHVTHDEFCSIRDAIA